ncbi:MAG: PASTA domain-containing protein, partial [Actinobacteria bacterium]|nr:PASTA domain-containing protein [Actinomycetota bacterium]
DIAAGMFAAYAIAFLGKGSSGPTTYPVQNVIGVLPSAVQTQLGPNFVAKAGPATSGPCDNGQSVKVGTVCTTEPKVGTDQPKGTTVTYNVYAQPTVTVPVLTGKQLSDAIYQLQQANLEFKTVEVNNVAPENQVIKQNPLPGTKVAPSSVVTVTYSSGVISLPDVRGLTYDQARAKLNTAQFPNVTQGNPTITHDSSKNGLVADESPTQGQTYSPSQTITLSVYQYVPAPPPSSSCASNTPSNSGSDSSSGSSSSASNSPSNSASKSPSC